MFELLYTIELFWWSWKTRGSTKATPGSYSIGIRNTMSILVVVHKSIQKCRGHSHCCEAPLLIDRLESWQRISQKELSVCAIQTHEESRWWVRELYQIRWFGLHVGNDVRPYLLPKLDACYFVFISSRDEKYLLQFALDPIVFLRPRYHSQPL